ncbi:hypothetical protein O0L34_g16326 [Tuta absoluta]|nr:hypothetical protein O0L34_g16326 [Tuta absoluta]
MKFLILASCVCMAVAAPQQRFLQRFVQPAIQPYARATAEVTSPAQVTKVTQVASQDLYNTAQVTADVAQNNYNNARTTYNTPQATYKNVAVKSLAGSEASAQILRDEKDVRPDGFNYYVETDNGIKSEATGELKQIGETAAIVVRGQYSYIGTDGVPVLVTYIADENGYQAQSDSIPVAPQLRGAIARSPQYIQTNSEVSINAARKF